jgi:DNA polymerase-3 subunit epsilon
VGTVSIWRRLTRWRGRASRRRAAAARGRPVLRSPVFRADGSPVFRADGSPAFPAGGPQALNPADRPALRADGLAACGALLTCGSRPLADTDFVIVDLETTGWTPGEARITEIGAVRFTGGLITGEFCTLVNPGMPIPADIAALTGISDAMVAQAPVIQAVLPEFLAFARGAVLAAHNAPFDLGFLVAACAACGLSWPDIPVLDTVTLARQVLGEAEVPDCKLATLATYFDAPTPPRHRALADARATAAVLHGLIGRLAASGVRTLAEISG